MLNFARATKITETKKLDLKNEMDNFYYRERNVPGIWNRKVDYTIAPC